MGNSTGINSLARLSTGVVLAAGMFAGHPGSRAWKLDILCRFHLGHSPLGAKNVVSASDSAVPGVRRSPRRLPTPHVWADTPE
jgi:hypothetical protein